ncbi:MAG: hypothetical protein RR307_05755 [Clostridia bacterium]
MQDNCLENEGHCLAVCSQCENVGVCVKLCTVAQLNSIKTECCGAPIVTTTPCQNKTGCCSCDIIITQTICSRISIDYKTSADISETVVKCLKENI